MALRDPQIIRLLGGVEYDRTYSVSLEAVLQLECYKELSVLATELRKVDPGDKILFFRDLLDENFTGEHLHKLFATLRDIIANLADNVMGALYAPLSYVGRSAGDFPLHSDLYIPRHLWNVFERVPRDGSGSPIFLPTSTFRELLDQCHVPSNAKTLLLNCLDDEAATDRFQSFYDLLYVEQSDWSDRLTGAMQARQIPLRLDYGQAYLLNDRKWLHGRLAPSGGVTTKRVHRLVFAPNQSL